MVLLDDSSFPFFMSSFSEFFKILLCLILDILIVFGFSLTSTYGDAISLSLFSPWERLTDFTFSSLFKFALIGCNLLKFSGPYT